MTSAIKAAGRTLLLAACALAAADPAAPIPPKLPDFPPLEFQPPKPERYVMDNGLTVFLLEDHELPLLKVSLAFRAGSQYDPDDKAGLSGLFGEAMTRGGSASHKPEDIERTLDVQAASVSFSVDLESGRGAMSCRAEDFDRIFAIFTDLLMRPAFRKDRVDLARAKALEALRRMNDEPEDVARRQFRQAVYGPRHPYARIPTPQTLKSIKREDLVAMHRRFVHPNAAWIAVSGRFDAAEMREKLRRAFGAWPRAAVTLPDVDPVRPPPGPQLYYIRRQISQSQIRIGGLGLARHSPDHFAWEVFNELYGGSGASRLFRTVRTQQGLAYSVASAFWEPAQKGLIVALCQTRAAETIAAAQSILKITENLREAPFTLEEIGWAKEAIRNRFIDNFTSSAEIASQRMIHDYFGYPPDYLDTYTDRIGRVGLGDLKRVGRSYLHPERNTILIMGDPSLFDKPLSTLGRPKEMPVPDYANPEE